MTRLRAEVLVIGGGATGAAAAWDAALRGFDVVLVDRADLAEEQTLLLNMWLWVRVRIIRVEALGARSAQQILIGAYEIQ